MEHTIKEQFKQLGCHSNGDGAYKVLSLAQLSHKLGKSNEGYPMFFVSVNDTTSLVKNITRELLSVEYNQLCRLSSEEGDVEKSYGEIQWKSKMDFQTQIILRLRIVKTQKKALRRKNLRRLHHD